MKKIVALLLAVVLVFTCASCGKAEEESSVAEPQIAPQVSQMKSICELAVMDCYYHNVAKFLEEDASGALWWKKDKHFWIEYSGVVTLGVDVSLVTIEVNESQITITIPEAEVQGCKVDSTPLTKDSYIVDKNSADVEAEDEIFAIGEAQKQLEETAANDKALLAEAQQRVKDLLEGYVNNIGTAVGKEYTINWKYVDSEGNSISSPSTNTETESDVSEESETEDSAAQ